MNSKLSLNQIRNDLKYLNKFEVIVYGSYASDNFTQRSDIDIAIITRKNDEKQNIEVWKKALRKVKPIYQMNVFELLPLNVKANVIDEFIVVFGDRLEISEYFYYFRKLWKDIKYRFFSNQFTHFREKIKKLQLILKN